MSEISDRYRTLAARLTGLVDSVPADHWDSPSPCEEWSAIEVLAHVTNTQREFLERFDFGPEGAIDEDPFRAWPQVRDAVQRVLDDPDLAATPYDGYFGPTTFEATIDGFYALDLLVHPWDIARATGLTEYEAMPPEEVSLMFAKVREMGDNLRQPGVCGPEFEIDPAADEQSRFVAFLGRQP